PSASSTSSRPEGSLWIETAPLAMMYIPSPGSPCTKTDSPATYSRRWRRRWSAVSSRRVRSSKSGMPRRTFSSPSSDPPSTFFQRLLMAGGRSYGAGERGGVGDGGAKVRRPPRACTARPEGGSALSRRPVRQDYDERGPLAGAALEAEVAVVALRHDLVGEGEAEAGALPARLRREERLEDAVRRLRADAGPVVGDADLDAAARPPRGDGDGGAVVRARLPRPLQDGVEGVGEEVDEDAAEVLRDEGDRPRLGG